MSSLSIEERESALHVTDSFYQNASGGELLTDFSFVNSWLLGFAHIHRTLWI